jgi:hypothetical protein
MGQVVSLQFERRRQTQGVALGWYETSLWPEVVSLIKHFSCLIVPLRGNQKT